MSGRAEEIIVIEGTWGAVVCAVCSNGSSPAKDFLNDLQLSKEGQKDYAALFAAFRLMANKGYISTKERFKKIEGSIWEFKKHQVRIGCFQVGRRWVLTHGFIKKRDKWPNTEIDRANRIMKEHLDK